MQLVASVRWNEEEGAVVETATLVPDSSGRSIYVRRGECEMSLLLLLFVANIHSSLLAYAHTCLKSCLFTSGVVIGTVDS